MSAAAPQAFARLFRHGVRDREVHPLLHLLQRHRGFDGVLAAVPVAAATGTAHATAALDPAALDRCVGALPPLPQALLALQSALRRDAPVDEIVDRLGRDQALAARTLRLANSAFYGVPGRVATLGDAVRVLGTRALASMLSTVAVNAAFAPPRCAGFDFGAFWRHALATAIAARAIARQRRGPDEELCFTAALLHDIGRLALASCFGEPYALALAEAQRLDRPAIEAERAVLGIAHDAVGAQVARHWRFPPAIAEVIATHHAPPLEGAAELCDVVHVADVVAHGLQFAHSPAEGLPPLQLAAWHRLALPAETWLAVFATVESGVADACRALGVQP